MRTSMATDIQLRSETPADVAAIDRVTTAAFLNAPHTDHTEQFIVRALRKHGQLTLSFVAVTEGEIVGHVALSPVTLSSGEKHWYGLGPISVAPAYQSEGIGTLLMKQALDDLRAIGASGCVVLGDPDYYSRFGFRPEATLVLADVPPEYFQAIVFTGSAPTAIVTYHESFKAQS
jgi:putative acetyltransferase